MARWGFLSLGSSGGVRASPDVGMCLLTRGGDLCGGICSKQLLSPVGEMRWQRPDPQCAGRLWQCGSPPSACQFPTEPRGGLSSPF